MNQPQQRGTENARTREPANARTPSSVQRVRAVLAVHGLQHLSVREFAESTATAADAAAAIETTVGRIVKSLVFMAGEQPVLVLTSGPNRVDTQKVSSLMGQPITRANADQVRQLTGFAVGGVPPVGHSQQLTTYVDRDLLQYDEVWAAAGTPNTVFGISPADLVRISQGHVEDVT